MNEFFRFYCLYIYLDWKKDSMNLQMKQNKHWHDSQVLTFIISFKNKRLLLKENNRDILNYANAYSFSFWFSGKNRTEEYLLYAVVVFLLFHENICIVKRSWCFLIKLKNHLENGSKLILPVKLTTIFHCLL